MKTFEGGNGIFFLKPFSKKHLSKTFLLFLFFITHNLNAQFNWVQKTNLPAPNRAGAVAFAIGNKGYLGTGEGSDFWEYDPANNGWTQKANFGGGYRSYAVGFSIGNFGYLGTGQDINANPTNDFWKYDPSLNTWTQIANVSNPRMQAVGFAIGSRGYVGTGWDGTNDFNDFWTYNPITDIWNLIPNFPYGVTCDIDRGVFVIGTRAYLGSGYNGGWSSNFYQYDQSTNAWTQKASVPGLPLKGAVGFSMCGYGFMGLGLDGLNPQTSLWMYDANQNTWSGASIFPGLPRWDIPSFVINNKAYMGTGYFVDYPNGVPTPTPTQDWWEFSETPVNATIDPSQTICIGSTASLNASGGINYNWSTGETTNSISVSPTVTTTYSVTVSKICSSQTVSTTVNVITSANSSFAFEYDPCKNKCVSFMDQSTNALTWEWDFGDGNNNFASSPCHIYSDSSLYSVSLIINNTTACADTFTLQVPYVARDTSAYVFIPTAFSPNGDGQNDRLRFFRKDNFCLQQFEIKIYDKWGEKVFETTDINDSWDGTYKGQLLNTSVFVYYCRVVTITGVQAEKKGDISLIR